MRSAISEPAFSPTLFLAQPGDGRTLEFLRPDEVIFRQGNQADSTFYMRSGRAKLSVVAPSGRQATVMLLYPQDFVGEESSASPEGMRAATATAITACTVLRIDRPAMHKVLREQAEFGVVFTDFLVARGARVQADLADRLLHTSEFRLARVLLRMACEAPGPGPTERIPPVTQEALADIVGTTRSRVSFFMNRFRDQGMIEYDGRIRVHPAQLREFLHEGGRG
jgi:CRP-like cAMP-binding protein